MGEPINEVALKAFEDYVKALHTTQQPLIDQQYQAQKEANEAVGREVEPWGPFPEHRERLMLGFENIFEYAVSSIGVHETARLLDRLAQLFYSAAQETIKDQMLEAAFLNAETSGSVN